MLQEAEVPTVRSAQDVSGEVEALLLVAEEPISEDALAEAIGRASVDDRGVPGRAGGFLR